MPFYRLSICPPVLKPTVSQRRFSVSPVCYTLPLFYTLTCTYNEISWPGFTLTHCELQEFYISRCVHFEILSFLIMYLLSVDCWRIKEKKVILMKPIARQTVSVVKKNLSQKCSRKTPEVSKLQSRSEDSLRTWVSDNNLSFCWEYRLHA